MCARARLRIDAAASDSPQGRTPSAFIRLLGRLERSEGLDPVVRAAEPLADRIVADERLRRVLHGDATGIPLHIILTDAPLGAWWMAQFLDLFPDDGMRRAATRLVGLGVVAAIPTALAGWAEWARADRGTRRVGIVHATANAVATLVFMSSWAARSRSRHDLGAWLGRWGGAVLLVGAVCGGYMRSDRQAVPDPGQSRLAESPNHKGGLEMYGVITTVPAPVEIYDGMHAEMLTMKERTGASVDGLLVHIGRATPDGFEVLEVWESREQYDRANVDIVLPLMRKVAADQPDPPIEQATEAFEVHGLVIPRANILI